MARNVKKPKSQTSSYDKLSQAQNNHVLSLGFKYFRDYENWCLSNGFSRNANKNFSQMQTEVAAMRGQQADSFLAAKKPRDYRKAIKRLLNGEVHQNLPGDVGPTDKPEYKKALAHLNDVSDSLFETVSDKFTFLDAFIAVFNHRADWVRPVETWTPKSHNARKQFCSLLRHLFALYDVPAFMDSVWLNRYSAFVYKHWYVHIGKGQNIRTAQDVPIPLTKKMAHYFLQAPDDYSPTEAVRWGEIMALGGNARLANALRGTRVMNAFDNNEFWQSVIRWFVANPMLDTAHFGPIIDYLLNQKFAGARPAPQPNLTMKNRSPDVLLSQVAKWHRELGKQKKYSLVKWDRCGIKGYEFVEGNIGQPTGKIWTIKELTTSSDLMEEGRKLKHCVSSYSHSCSSGRCAIWSMKCETLQGRYHILTIETTVADKTIVQARGACNRFPNTKEHNIIQRWASQNGLKSLIK